MAAIPPKLEPEVLNKAGDGWTTRRIAEWLHEVHKVETSHKTVANLLNRIQAERAPIAKAVVRQTIAKSINVDLERMEKHARQLDELADDCFAKIKAEAFFAKNGSDGPVFVEGREVYAKLVEQIRKITDTKLHYSGAEEPDPDSRPRPVILIPAESID